MISGVFLLLEAVSSRQDPVLVDQGSTTHVDEVFTSPGTNLEQRVYQAAIYRK